MKTSSVDQNSRPCCGCAGVAAQGASPECGSEAASLGERGYRPNRRALLEGLAGCAAVALGGKGDAAGPGRRGESVDEALPSAYPATGVGETVRYIWGPGRGAGSLRFRRSFDVAGEPLRGILSVLNDARFGLWVNGEAVRGVRDGASWRLASTYDVTRLLRRGRNVVAIESEALNTEYHSQPLTPLAGFAARLEYFAGGQIHHVESGPDWEVAEPAAGGSWNGIEDAGSAWQAAMVVGAANSAPWINVKNWPWLLADPASKRLRLSAMAPAEVRVFRAGELGPGRAAQGVVTLEADRAMGATWHGSAHVGLRERLAFARKTLPRVTIDFGREVAGRIRVQSGSGVPVALVVALGESPGEMWNAPHTGLQDIFLAPQGAASTIASGFRYASIYAAPLTEAGAGAVEVELSEIVCERIEEPQRQVESFRASDAVVEQLWRTGVETARLCLQRELWDAPKRDRNPYGGDLQPVSPIWHQVFGNPEPVYRTLNALRDGIWQPGEPILRHVNGICSYSANWVLILAGSFELTGDEAALEAQLPFLMALLAYMEGDLDAESLFRNPRRQMCFVDWAKGFGGDGAKADQAEASGAPESQRATHFYFLAAFRAAATLLRALGGAAREAAAGRYEALAARMQSSARRHWWNAVTGSYGERVQTNTAAICAGAVNSAEAVHIADTVLLAQARAPQGALDWDSDEQIVTPYFRFYVLDALERAGRLAEAHGWMRGYYGEILRRGATTFPEHFDPRSEAAEAIPGYGPDWWRDPGTGEPTYHRSLCHGWSSAPTSWITRQMLGVRPAAAGFRRLRVEPRLFGLSWVEGSVWTPRGAIQVRHEQQAGRWTTEIELPVRTEALVYFPEVEFPEAELAGVEPGGKAIHVNGRAQKLDRDADGRSVLKIALEGRVKIEVG